MFYSLQKQRKHGEERSFGRFKMSLKCDRMFTLVSGIKIWLIFELNTGTHWKINSRNLHRAVIDAYETLV